MVGAGALGCQYAKLFARSGICCGATGTLFVADDDTVSCSNLHRQFLFKPSDVGLPKAEAVCLAIKQMNNTINTRAKCTRITTANPTEFLNDDEWERLSAVIGAVDSATARVQLDELAHFYSIPFVESGTSGTTCSASVVIPQITARYNGFGAPTTMRNCTTREFPYHPDHLAQWAFDVHLQELVGQLCLYWNCINTPSFTGSAAFDDLVKLKNDKDHRIRFATKLLEEKFIKGIEHIRLQNPPEG